MPTMQSKNYHIYRSAFSLAKADKAGIAFNPVDAARFALALGCGTRIRYGTKDVYFVNDARTDHMDVARIIEGRIKTL